MAISNILRLISSTFILVGIILTVPAPVHAASITTDPTSGTVGTTISITGEGFTGQLATIRWDDQIVARDIRISETGSLKYDYTVPPSPRGEHVIFIDDDSNWAPSSASLNFTVLPSIGIFPETGNQWIEITVTGKGFGSFEDDIQMIWDGEIQPGALVTADRLGTWHYQFTIPSTGKGIHYLSANGSATSTTEIGDIPFIVSPWVTIEPVSGPVGTQFIVKGWGFRTMEDGITVTWDGVIIMTNIEAEYDGSLLLDGSKWESDGIRDLEYRESVFVPETTQGKHIIGVYGSSFTPKGVLPDTEFLVTPQINVEPLSGKSGSEITLSGSGFANNEPVNISFHKTVIDTDTVTNDVGSFSVTLKVPEDTAKENNIIVIDSSGNSAETDFTSVETVILQAPQLMLPTDGTSLTIFNSVGDVFIGTAKYFLGIFDYWKGLRDNSSQPYALTFGWTDLNPKIKAKYILQVASDSTFATNTLNKEILNNTEYALNEADALTRGSYYWRVKAQYDEGKESPWSQASGFVVNSMPVSVFILSLVIALLCLAAIVFGILLAWANFKR
jgi:hypothetical protein